MGDAPLTRGCVFCGSAVGARPEYADAARALAGELAPRGLGLVYGLAVCPTRDDGYDPDR